MTSLWVHPYKYIKKLFVQKNILKNDSLKEENGLKAQSNTKLRDKSMALMILSDPDEYIANNTVSMLIRHLPLGKQIMDRILEECNGFSLAWANYAVIKR